VALAVIVDVLRISRLQQLQSVSGFASEVQRERNGRLPENCPTDDRPVRRSAEVSETTIVVRCPDCRSGRVSAPSVTVRWCLDTNAWSYRTRCSVCEIVFVATTREDRAHRALAAGAILEMWTLPAELTERPGAGRPIDAVDILELRLALMEPEWFDKLRAMTFPDDRTR
jgi:hypothetical protein